VSLTFESVNITDPKKFLNDLMLSPYWRVTRNRSGAFVAEVRWVNAMSPSESVQPELLSSFVQSDRPLLGDRGISHRGSYRKGAITDIRATIQFAADPNATVVVSGEKTSLPIYGRGSAMDPNGVSRLAVRLSQEHEVYVVIRETGESESRECTLGFAREVLRDIKAVVELPEDYRITERYSALFKAFFPDTSADCRLERIAGFQDVDTVYGFVAAKEGRDLQGVSIKISHPVYCGGEGSRRNSDQFEYLGVPSRPESDRLFFVVENNVVILKPEYNGKFGIWHGSDSFEGDMELIGGDGAAIGGVKSWFRGWER
jgi:hypothetical protein